MNILPSQAESHEGRALILAPFGRDSAIATKLLGEANVPVDCCDSLKQLVYYLKSGAGCAVITQEAIQTADLHPLFHWLGEQPPWSDLPLIIVTERGGGPERNPGALRLMQVLSNLTFLERPFHSSTLLSVVQTALRSRRRQYAARAQLAELSAREKSLQDSEMRFRILTQTLEQQVADRTARLKGNEAQLRAIFETSFMAQLLLTPEGKLLDANATSLAMIDTGIDQVRGRDFWDTPWFSATPGMRLKIKKAVTVVAAGENVREEMSIRLAGGARDLDFSLRPVRNEQGKVIAIVPEAIDITAKRQVQEALRQAQKMEAVGQLTGGIAHDFNNMLQGIAAGIELMRKRIRAGRADEAERYVEVATQSIGRAAALTHRLLAFSRRQALMPRPVNIDRLVDDIGGLMNQTVGPSVNVKVNLQDGCWSVKCDPNQLENALLNLAINARDAMLPAGGDLLLQTEHVMLRAADVAGWEDAEPGAYVRISVIDNGVGMPADVLEHAFEPFYTTKPAGQGTGLGLSQVFGFISQSNGVVRIDSQPGKGTAVHLFLPRLEETEEIEAAASHTDSGWEAGESATVLLVEDEAEIRQLAAETLRDAGHTVLEAKDGPSGLNLLRDQLNPLGPPIAAPGGAPAGTKINILVADVGLPGGLNGRQLADAARELMPNLPVLLITGYAGEALGAGLELRDRMEILAKPFALEALAAHVGTMIRDQTRALERSGSAA